MREEKPSVVFFCCEVDNGSRCNAKDNLISIDMGNDRAMFYCLKHYDKRRTKSASEIKFEEGVQLLRDQAKRCNMSNKDFCRDQLGLTDIGKDYLEKITKEDDDDIWK